MHYALKIITGNDSLLAIKFLTRSSNATETNGFTICGWKGKFSVRPLIPKPDHTHYLLLCGEEGLENKLDNNISESVTAEDTAINSSTSELLQESDSGSMSDS